MVLCGISNPFGPLSPCRRQVPHALLTRPPLGYLQASSPIASFDLHVLSTPPAFVLSQDQTLVFNPSTCSLVSRPLSEPLPQTKLKLISIDCRSSFLTLLYRFQGPPRSLASGPFRTAPHERLCILSLIPSPCQHLFLLFSMSSHICPLFPFEVLLHSLNMTNV